MSYQTNQELLNEFREAEKLLRKANASLKRESGCDLTGRIADHMRKWEDGIHQTLCECEQETGKGTEETFNQAAPHGSPVERIQKNLPVPEDPAELAHWSLKRHEELADWCETLAEQTVSERTEDLFHSLADQIRDINRQLATDTRSLAQE